MWPKGHRGFKSHPFRQLETCMKNKKIFYGIAILFLIGLSLFVLNNYQIQVQERPDKPIKLPPQISGRCGIENCHGLNITCGPNVPETCDLMYRVGDNCRQYASCQKTNGQCQLVKTKKFDECKSCVGKCEQNFKNDPINFFQCENKCTE